jgi:ribosomal protein S6
MPVDLRYHLISIVAVFLALAIGLLIGFSMVSSPQLEEQVKALNEQVNETIEKLNEKVKAQDQFIDAATPLVLADRLAGRQIAVVIARKAGDREQVSQAVEACAAAISKAGGQVSCVVEIGHRFYRLGDPTYERTRAAVVEALGLDASDLDALPILAAGAFAENLVLATERARKVEKSKAVNFIDPYPYQPGTDSLVLVGGLRDEDDTPLEMFDLPLIAKCLELRPAIRVVACEMTDAPVSAITRYKHAGVAATVDNIDSHAGRMAVVLALQGRVGHFGTKDTADSLLPATDSVGATAQR